MKRWVALGFISCFLHACGVQNQQAQIQPAQKVIEEFCRFETAGGRLTGEGWLNGNKFFVRAMPPPQNFSILVTANDYSVWPPFPANSPSANVIVGVSDIWKVDSTMHVTRSSSPKYFKSGIGYKVVLSDKHWELGADKKTLHEVTGSPAWRIDEAGNTIWLTLDTAVQYLSGLRDKSKSLQFKKDVNKAIALLKRHLHNA
ncbi:MAG TPA: hypothetical protein VGN44_17280 [Candidatus Angelobacter sp.]|jgi:hypothetical protein